MLDCGPDKLHGAYNSKYLTFEETVAALLINVKVYIITANQGTIPSLPLDQMQEFIKAQLGSSCTEHVRAPPIYVPLCLLRTGAFDSIMEQSAM